MTGIRRLEKDHPDKLSIGNAAHHHRDRGCRTRRYPEVSSMSAAFASNSAPSAMIVSQVIPPLFVASCPNTFPHVAEALARMPEALSPKAPCSLSK